MNLKSVLENDLCTGCGLCSSVHPHEIVMALNDDGFLRPKPVSNEILSTDLPYCPGVSLKIEGKEPYNILNWGNIIDCKVGYSNDTDVRYKGSSGGVLSQLGIYLLEKKLIDGVIHIGVLDSDPIANVIKVSRCASDVINSAGSRYAPAAPLEKIIQILDCNAHQKFAFIGKPCDAAALRTFILTNPLVQERIPYIFSFMCAGTPSIKGTEEVLDKLGIKKENLISFKYRGDGWPGVTKAIDRDFNERTMTYNESWGDILGKHLQKRCKICPDGIGEFADVVCADAWHGNSSGYPDFEEKDGRSLILSRTDTGYALINEMTKAKSIDSKPFEISELNIIQPAQRHRRQSLLARLIAMKLMARTIPSFSGFNLYKGARSISIKRNIYAFMGMIVRIYRKKI